MAMNVEIPTEEQEQIALMEWAKLMEQRWPCLRLLFHIPNGGKRGKREAARFKLMGVKPGVPDLFLPVARGIYHGLCIEMKRSKGGAATPTQIRWARELRAQGYDVWLCHGWQEAANAIEGYLANDR